MFSASVGGAKASAHLYSLVETAKANGLEPYAYLKQVFTQLPAATCVGDVEKLLPGNIEIGKVGELGGYQETSIASPTTATNTPEMMSLSFIRSRSNE